MTQTKKELLKVICEYDKKIQELESIKIRLDQCIDESKIRILKSNSEFRTDVWKAILSTLELARFGTPVI